MKKCKIAKSVYIDKFTLRAVFASMSLLIGIESSLIILSMNNVNNFEDNFCNEFFDLTSFDYQTDDCSDFAKANFRDGKLTDCFIHKDQLNNQPKTLKLKIFCTKNNGAYHEVRGTFNYNVCSLT